MAEDRDLLAVAVSRYADTCGPSLHVDCPYSHDDGAGLICGQECRQIVADLVRPRVQQFENSLLPFDAQQALHSSVGITQSPTVAWSTTALLFRLKQVALSRTVHPMSGLIRRNVVDATSALAVLEERGVDSQALLVEAVWPLVARAIDLTVSLAGLRFSNMMRIDDRFRSLLELRNSIIPMDPELVSQESMMGSKLFRGRVESWLQSADVEAAFSWALPHDLPQVDALPAHAEASEFGWLLDRFSETYLDKWSKESLAFEFRLLNEGFKPAFIPHSVLSERKLNRGEVAQELASRSMDPFNVDIETRTALTERALEAIQDGRRDLAATVFASVREMEPASQEWANNHGFCLIPDNHPDALKALLESRRLGRRDTILAANIALTHLLLGDPQSALTECENVLESGLHPKLVAYLWNVDSLEKEPEIDPGGSVAVYVCDIAIRSAQQLGQTTKVEQWNGVKKQQEIAFLSATTG